MGTSVSLWHWCWVWGWDGHGQSRESEDDFEECVDHFEGVCVSCLVSGRVRMNECFDDLGNSEQLQSSYTSRTPPDGDNPTKMLARA